MAATVFQKQTPASLLFYAQTPVPGLAAFKSFNLRMAWALGAVTSDVQSKTLLDAWAAGGVFLFLGVPLIDEATFIDRLARLTTQPQYRAARILWIANPNAREDQWILWNIRVSMNADGAARVGAIARFDFLNYAFLIGAGCSFTPSESSFVIGPLEADSIFLTVQYGAARLAVTPRGPVTVSYVDSPGSLTFPMEAPHSFFDDVDAGCRLFFDGGSTRYPVFAPAGAVDLNLTLDPLAPLDPSRTVFALAAGQTLSSHYRTNAGRAATLTPMAGARLQFAPLPVASRYYLVPAGPFGIQAPGMPPRLLCGIFGAEFIELTGDSILTFTPGQPAFLQDAATLNFAATTSWAAVSSPSATLCYSAVPDGAGFFAPAQNQDFSLLEYYDACSAFLPQSAAPPYPLLPYAGVQTADFEDIFFREQRLLAPLRRAIVQANQAASPVLSPTGAANDVVALTPQGMAAQFSADRTQWKTLTIGASESGPFQLTAIVDPLRSALLTNQQFVVISDPAALAQNFATGANTVQIAGWKFTLDQAGWRRYGAILIVKNSPRALSDLAGDLNSWTLAGRFNASPAAAQQQIIAILKQAGVQSGTVEFDYFANTVAIDPGWNGVLILNCPLTAFPDSFQGLSGAVNPGGMFAHHVGFNQTPVAPAVTAQNSQIGSIFGLIDYSDATPASGFGEFEFKVTVLKVLFRNSAVSSLVANADLYVRALFGSAVSASSRAPLKLKGTIEAHGSANVFALVSDEGPRTLALDDAVLSGVSIGNIHFATKSAGAGAITSRFDFWGALSFAVPGTSADPFDIFSYDGLSFSKLGVNMSTTGAGAQSFEFDPFAMKFDISASSARANSLAAQFPMQLKGFTISTDKTTPTGAGYLAVALSQVNVAPVAPPWYGLVFNLNLGTLGALAADVGFVPTFALIWSPGSGTPRAFAGIHFPGLSGGQDQVSLMGVLKLGMQNVELVRQGGEFVLLLDGVALKFMGKSLPPGGSFDFYLFGSQGANQLAWYGAFLKGQ